MEEVAGDVVLVVKGIAALVEKREIGRVFLVGYIFVTCLEIVGAAIVNTLQFGEVDLRAREFGSNEGFEFAIGIIRFDPPFAFRNFNDFILNEGKEIFELLAAV